MTSLSLLRLLGEMGAYSGRAAPSQARKVQGTGLEQNVVVWEPRFAAVPEDDPQKFPTTVLLLHGYMDVAASWQPVAHDLAAAGFRCIAPDLRGFGDGPRAPPGTHYYFPDYVVDVVDLLAALEGDMPELSRPIHVVGHSMGGMVGTLFAGAFPDRVARLATLEGLGPPDSAFEDAPSRMREFVESARKGHAQRGSERAMVNLDEVVRRLSMNHPAVPEHVLRARAPMLARAREDGTFVWRFDPLHRARSPVPFYAAAFRAFAARIACPVLHVSGGATGYHPRDERERLSAFRDLRETTLEGAGHMMHWTQPEALARALLDFLA